MKSSSVSWAVFNQTHTPSHQRLFERLSRKFGPCCLLTGTPFPVEEPSLLVVSGPVYRRESLRRRVTSWLLFAVHALWVGVRLPRGTLVVAVTNPPLLPHVAWVLSHLRGLRYAVLVWDVYPDLLVATSLLGERHVIVRAWRWMNVRVLARASLVITLGDVMAEKVKNQFADPNVAAVEVIPNWVQTEAIKPLAKTTNDFARRYGQADKITILYAGNIGSAHGVERIVWIADRMKDDPRFSFLIVGEGLGLPKVLSEVSRAHAQNLQVLPHQPWDTLPELLATAEIAIVMQDQGTEALSMPSKTYSSMAAGSAILALTDPISDLADVVLHHEAGRVCDQDDIECATSSLWTLGRDPERLEEARRRSRKTAVNVFSEEVVYRQWIGCLANLVGPERDGRRKGTWAT